MGRRRESVSMGFSAIMEFEWKLEGATTPSGNKIVFLQLGDDGSTIQ